VSWLFIGPRTRCLTADTREAYENARSEDGPISIPLYVRQLSLHAVSFRGHAPAHRWCYCRRLEVDEASFGLQEHAMSYRTRTRQATTGMHVIMSIAIRDIGLESASAVPTCDDPQGRRLRHTQLCVCPARTERSTHKRYDILFLSTDARQSK
jgi:hypothetical protein